MNILLSEVAGAGRWSQFNLKLDWVTPFFNVPSDSPSTINLCELDKNGKIISTYATETISKPNSSNWAFEIPGASDLHYPSGDLRPIIAIGQLGGGNFSFDLIMPHEQRYDAVHKFLVANTQTTDRELERCILPRASYVSIASNLSV